MFDADEPISDYQKVIRGMYLNKGVQEDCDYKLSCLSQLPVQRVYIFQSV